MITDEERREVAQRLREIRPCKSGHIKWWEIARALGLKQPAGWFGWEKFEPDSANRLADLIEPGEPKVKCVAEVKVDGERLEKLAHDVAVKLIGIDRDALLAIAEEIVEMFRLGAFTGEGIDAKWCRELHDKYARRIREACGVEDG